MLALAIGSAFALPALAANLIPNPDFTSGTVGWTMSTTGSGSATLDTTTGSPDAPSVRLVANPANTDVSVFSSCVEVDDSQSVDLFVDLRGNTGAATIEIDTFSDAACATALSQIVSTPVQADQTWSTYTLDNVALPNGSQSAMVVLTATEGTDASAGDANFDHIQLGATGTVPGFVDVNQEGLSGTWFNPPTAGQGMQFTFSPDDANPGVGTVFGTWYTFDTTAGDETTQRWYTIQAALTTAESVDFPIYQNTGGNFDSPPVTSAVQVGTGSLAFDSCTSGTFTYAFDDGRAGTIPLTRIMPNVNCVETGTPAIVPSDFGLSGTYYDPATAGQGILVEINPDNAYAFVGWYTYALAGETSGAAGQRWITAQAPYTVGSRAVDLTLYDTTGGTFDSDVTTTTTTPIGSATLTFTSCTTATFDYTITAGELAGQSDSIPLSRLGSTPASCSTITQ
ncbi:MAG TPA: hypothetical protein VJX31_03900 [Casimicrobiaceae bacterium]|nr:hypothetical protein [Casimicrobiaceae bacterium]